MKIIFSRKGFDSGYGGVPSPIFPDGSILSMPIPSPAGVAAGTCRFLDQSIGEIAEYLTKDRVKESTLVHLDPDLRSEALVRDPGWRPAFGQVGAAQSHLRNQGVGPGDLFLFFGWFQPVVREAGKWAFDRSEPSFHSLFGWLQVESLIHVDAAPERNIPEWLKSHPHIAHAQGFSGQNNTIYVGADHLKFEARHSNIGGAGHFNRWSTSLTMSASGRKRSLWNVPSWLEPTGGRVPLTYHHRPERWQRTGSTLLLQTVSKGQEFVFDSRQYPEAIEWVANIIEEHA